VAGVLSRAPRIGLVFASPTLEKGCGMTSIRRGLLCVALLGALGLFGASPVLAATHIWTGPAGGAWSSPANWNGGVPTTGESGGTIVQFGSNTSSSMDIGGLVVDQIHFTGTGNTIDGTTILGIDGSTLVENLVSDGASNTLDTSLPIALSGANSEVVSAGGTLSIDGAVTGPAGLVFISTGGGFSMSAGNTGDSYTGSTYVESGVLHMASANGVVISGSSLSIGTSGSAAQLVDDQSSDISSSTAITIGSAGTLNLGSEIESAQSLQVDGGTLLGGALNLSGGVTMTGGSIALGTGVGHLTATSLSMTGGSISGSAATFDLMAPGSVTATSSATGPATISTHLVLATSPTITVSPGSAPAFRVTGPISQSGGTQGVTKLGAGTMLTSGTNTYSGTTTINAGTLEADGSQPGAVNVSLNGTLTGSGTVGPATVAGVLAPVAPGMNTGSLDLLSTARLDQTISSPSSVPSVLVTGSVSIDPSAALNVVVSPGIPMPHGSTLTLIGNDAADPISGPFANVANGSVITTPDGVPLTVNYAGGDGNDLTLTAGNVPPQAGAVSAGPNPATAGQPVAFSVAATDANHDPLITTWNFGDGTPAGNGSTVSHTYAVPGHYTVVATVSDGLAQTQSTAVVTVNPGGGGSSHGSGSGSGNPPSATTVATATAFGGTFRLAVPRACVRKGTTFNVSFSAKKQRNAKGAVLQKVTKVVFAVAGGIAKSVRSAPFSTHLTVPAKARSGATVNVTSTASLALRGGRHRTKRLSAPLTVC
jgi:autotransporter-associated beta strand protein